MRVLLIAEACNPEWVSVPLVGWSHAAALRQVADVHLVTQIRNAAAIERAGLVPDRDFTSIDTEPLARPAHKLAGLLRGGSGKGWTTVTAINALTYPFFEFLVWRRFGNRIRAREFDVVHRLTPLTPTASSSLARKCRGVGVPYVIGPLNGGVPWPAEFDAARRKEKEWLSYVRGLYRLLPGYRSTRRNTAAILIGSKDTWDQMPARYHGQCEYIPENAIDPARFPAVARSTPSQPLRAIFVGRLVPYKGADMLLEAVAPLLRAGRLHLTIVGQGPQLPELQKFVEAERLQAGVTFAGWQDHAGVARLLGEADLFTFPSIREFGGGVVLEAMACGVVPVVVAYGGPAELVTPSTGYAVQIGSRAQIIERFHATITALCDEPAPLSEQSKQAARRARELFTWTAKAAQTLQVYRWVTGQAPKPNFSMPTPDLVASKNAPEDSTGRNRV